MLSDDLFIKNIPVLEFDRRIDNGIIYEKYIVESLCEHVNPYIPVYASYPFPGTVGYLKHHYINNNTLYIDIAMTIDEECRNLQIYDGLNCNLYVVEEVVRNYNDLREIFAFIIPPTSDNRGINRWLD